MKQRFGLFIVFLFILGCDGELNRSVSMDRDGVSELPAHSQDVLEQVGESDNVPKDVVFDPVENVNEPDPVESDIDLPVNEPDEGQNAAQKGEESQVGDSPSESDDAVDDGCRNGSDSVDSCGEDDLDKTQVDSPKGSDDVFLPEFRHEPVPGGTSSETDNDDHQSAVAVEAAGLDNLYRVSDELYRSAQPDAEGLVSAKMLGIKTVLSLQLITFDTALEETAQSGLTLVHVPMVPWSIPMESLVEALLTIKNADKPVLVHCLHGSDRTGTIVALYRILFENWSREEALTEMTSETFGYHEEFENLPAMIEGLDLDALYQEVFQ